MLWLVSGLTISSIVGSIEAVAQALTKVRFYCCDLAKFWG